MTVNPADIRAHGPLLALRDTPLLFVSSTAEEAERYASGAAGSRSAAEAVRRRLQALVGLAPPPALRPGLLTHRDYAGTLCGQQLPRPIAILPHNREPIVMQQGFQFLGKHIPRGDARDTRVDGVAALPPAGGGPVHDLRHMVIVLAPGDLYRVPLRIR